METTLKPIEQAILLVTGQSQSALARHLSILTGVRVSPQAVQQWVAKDCVPAKWCRPIAMLTNYRMTEAMLRPDIFGPVHD